MSCCSEYADLGCFDGCDTITLGYNASQTGAHEIQIMRVQGSWSVRAITYTAPNAMTIPSGILPEVGTHQVKIKQPDGTFYEFSTGVDCGKITTEIHYVIT